MYDLNELIIKIQDVSFDEYLFYTLSNKYIDSFSNFDEEKTDFENNQEKIDIENEFQIAEYGNLTNDQFLSLFNRRYMRIPLSKNSNLTEVQIDYLLELKDNNITVNLLKNSKLYDKFDYLINNDKIERNNLTLLRNMSVNSNLTEFKINKLINIKDTFINSNLSKNCKLSNDQCELLLKGYDNGYYLVQNINLNDFQFKLLFRAYSHSDSDFIISELAKNPNLTKSQINLLLNLKSDRVDKNLYNNKAIKKYDFSNSTNIAFRKLNHKKEALYSLINRFYKASSYV